MAITDFSSNQNATHAANPLHISIIGSCVPRDTFELCKIADGYKPDFENTYVVDRFIQSIGLISAISQNIKKKFTDALIKESEASKAVNFYKRNFKLDVSKSWDDYLSEVKSDWLIVDFSTARSKLISFENSLFSSTLLDEIVSANQSELSKGSLLYKLKTSKIIDPSEYDKDFLKECYCKYFDKLTSIYPQERIIVLDVRHAFSYVNEPGSKIALSDYAREQRQLHENELIKFAYDCAKEYMPNAHFVDALPVFFGDATHKWGMMGLHYISDVYLYFYRCIDHIINSNEDETSEKMFLQKTQLDFSRKLFERFYTVTNKSTEADRNKLCLKNGISTGEYQKGGIKLTIADDFSFSICGEATEDLVFYLFSSHKNPLGAWGSLKASTPSGKYRFATGTKCIGENFFVQLVLTDSALEKKWIKCTSAVAKFQIDKPYEYQLVRVVIKKGTTVNEIGRLYLEKID